MATGDTEMQLDPPNEASNMEGGSHSDKLIEPLTPKSPDFDKVEPAGPLVSTVLTPENPSSSELSTAKPPSPGGVDTIEDRESISSGQVSEEASTSEVDPQHSANISKEGESQTAGTNSLLMESEAGQPAFNSDATNIDSQDLDHANSSSNEGESEVLGTNTSSAECEASQSTSNPQAATNDSSDGTDSSDGSNEGESQVSRANTSSAECEASQSAPTSEAPNNGSSDGTGSNDDSHEGESQAPGISTSSVDSNAPQSTSNLEGTQDDPNDGTSLENGKVIADDMEVDGDDGTDLDDGQCDLDIEDCAPMGDWEIRSTKKPVQKAQEPPELTQSHERYLKTVVAQFRTGTVKEHQTSDLPEYSVHGLDARLPAYQLIALAQLKRRAQTSRKQKGCILALEMGLGKTFIMMAYLADQLNNKQNVKCLIVLPSNLALQWAEQIEKHMGSEFAEDVCTHLHAERNEHSETLKTLKKFSVVITSYTIVQMAWARIEAASDAKTKRHATAKKGALHSISFNDIIIDEGTHINNWGNSTFRAVQNLQGKHKWILTGTPARNTVEDYYSFLSCIGVKGARNIQEFRIRFTEQENSKVGNEALYRVLRKVMIRMSHDTPLFGRPLLELPTPEFHWIRTPQSTTEAWIYKKLSDLLLAAANPRAETSEQSKGRLFTIMQYQRQGAVSPWLLPHFMRMVLKDKTTLVPGDKARWDAFDALARDSAELLTSKRDCQNLRRVLREVASKLPKTDTSPLRLFQDRCEKHPRARIKLLAKKLPMSSKMRSVMDCLGEIIKYTDEKIVVFCHFYDAILMIKQLTYNAGWRAATYHGKMSLELKHANLNEFRENSTTRILIASLTCGANGINLEYASRVLLVDLWWNEAAQAQAFARVYRRGQTRKTHFYRFLTIGTIDEYLYSVQTGKEEILSEAMKGQGAFVTEDGEDDTTEKGRAALCEDYLGKIREADYAPLSEENERMVNEHLKADNGSIPRKRCKPSDGRGEKQKKARGPGNDKFALDNQPTEPLKIDYDALSADDVEDRGDDSDGESSDSDEEYVPNKKAKTSKRS